MKAGPVKIFSLLLGLAVASLFLLLLEGGARLLPLERWERDNPNLSYPLFVPGTGADEGYYVGNPHFADVTRIQRFAREKPPGVKRVFVLGSSAALGWPGDPRTAFTGYLQRAMEKVAPGRYEIINAAAVSYGSHRQLDLLADIVRMEPDLVIVWSGNNEYVERNALTRFARTEAMGKAQRVLRHSALYRSLRIALGAVAPSLFVRADGEDITDPRKVPQVRRGMLGRSAESDRQVLDNYRNNLRAMARLLKENGVAGIFCTVPVNLSAWVPINLPPELDEPAQAASWQEIRESAFWHWEQNHFGPAAMGLETLLKMTPRYAFARYLLGDCYRNMERLADAEREFNLAREYDPRPVRALPAFEDAVRAVAAETGTGLVDLEKAFLRASGRNLAGLDLFLDYVHPNEAGHKLAATVLLPEMAGRLGTELPVGELTALIQADNWLEETQFHQAEMFYALGMTLSNNGDLAGAERSYLKALEDDPNYPEPAGNIGAIYEHRGDLETAKQWYLRAVQADAGTIYNGHLARVLYRMGDRAGARAAGERLISQGVVDVGLLRLLGDVAGEDGRYADAVKLYRQAVEAGDPSAELQERLGDVYRRLGNEANAAAAYDRAKALRSQGQGGR